MAPRGRLDRSHGIVLPPAVEGDALVRRIESATGSQEGHANDGTARIAGGS
jgi:hypothetical protein